MFQDPNHLFKTVRRTWLDRLFSWNPFRATKQVRDLEAEYARDAWQMSDPVAAVFLQPGREVVEAIRSRVPKPAPWPPAPQVNRGHVPPRPMPAPMPPKPVVIRDPEPIEDNSLAAAALTAAWLSPRPAMRFEPEVEPAPEFRSGGGGDFGGAGASGGWDAPAPEPAPAPSSSPDSSSSCSGSD